MTHNVLMLYKDDVYVYRNVAGCFGSEYIHLYIYIYTIYRNLALAPNILNYFFFRSNSELSLMFAFRYAI